MTFVLRMALRETRASWQRLLFFFLCIAIGVGAIVAIRSVVQNVRGVLTGEARTLLGADIVVGSTQPLSAEQRGQLDRRLSAAGAGRRTESVETPTMVRPADPAKSTARMVELKAVDDEFPLVGEVQLAGGVPYSPTLLADRGVLVRPELLMTLGVAVGESVLIGGTSFTIRGVIEREPGRRVGGFSLGPRVLVSRAGLDEAGLLAFGSRARYQIGVRVPDASIDPLTTTLREDFKNTYVNVRSWRRLEDNIGEDLERAENYLSLVGLVIVVLGGIGVSSVTRVFVDQKLRSIAVLKCVGAGTRQVLAVYLVQVLLLGLAGSLAGLGLARLALAFIPERVGTALSGYALSHALTVPAMLQGLGIGLLVSLLFAIVPLLRVRHVRPSLLLRNEQDAGRRRFDWVRWGAVVGVTAGVVALAGWQAASWRVGAAVCGGFAVLAGVLQLAGWLLVKTTRPLQRSRHFALRHAVLHLNRPGNQTRVVLLAVGLGSFFLVGVRAVQSNLLREFAIEAGANAPDMFLIDVQRDQAQELHAFLRERTGSEPRLLPVLRARITQVRGKATNLDDIEDVRGRGPLSREYGITYRAHLQANETLVQGRFWDATPSPEPEVSIEESILERFQIGVGDTIRFDVAGQPIAARVTSVRRVNWRDARAGGFIFVFRPGVLEQAPQTMISAVTAPQSLEDRARFQRDLVARFPNVSAIDIREVLDTVRAIVRNITLGITIVGGLVLFTGVLILVGAVAMTKFRRVYEAAILKTLGASSRLVGSVLLVEHGLLGLLAGVIGAAGGMALSYGITRHVFELTWHVPWFETVSGVIATTTVVAIVGVLASLDVLRRKPLATLRAE